MIQMVSIETSRRNQYCKRHKGSLLLRLSRRVITKAKKLMGAFLLGMMRVSEAQQTEKVGQGGDSSTMPVIKSLSYSFDAPDIGRGPDEKIGPELSGAFTGKHMWNGLDLLSDYIASIPAGTIIFGNSSLGAEMRDVC